MNGARNQSSRLGVGQSTLMSRTYSFCAPNQTLSPLLLFGTPPLFPAAELGPHRYVLLHVLLNVLLNNF